MNLLSIIFSLKKSLLHTSLIIEKIIYDNLLIIKTNLYKFVHNKIYVLQKLLT